jgi:hypothetical protein
MQRTVDSDIEGGVKEPKSHKEGGAFLHMRYSSVFNIHPERFELVSVSPTIGLHTPHPTILFRQTAQTPFRIATIRKNVSWLYVSS